MRTPNAYISSDFTEIRKYGGKRPAKNKNQISFFLKLLSTFSGAKVRV